jgi:hypothetical protein
VRSLGTCIGYAKKETIFYFSIITFKQSIRIKRNDEKMAKKRQDG